MIIDLSKINFGGGGGGETAKLQKKSMTVSSATATIVPDAGYDGMTKVDVDATEYGTSNYNDGVLAQKAKLTEINITENGTYTKEDGYSNVIVDVKAPTETIDLDTGISFANSIFKTLPFNITGGSNRTDFNSLFRSTEITSLDLTTIDISKATNISFMFAYMYSLKSISLANFNTENVIIFKDLFEHGEILQTLDLSLFNTNKGTEFQYMFYYCSSLTSLDIRNFDLTNADNTISMFWGCDALTTINVSNCNDVTKNKILTQLQTDLKSHTWTLGDDGIIRRTT